jgi:anthranilate phosphoribosyltransferase
VILNGIEGIFTPELLHYQKTIPTALSGGATVKDASDIFINILKGQGTKAQNDVIVVNSQIALKCCLPGKSFDECRSIAEESLFSGKAFASLNKLIEMQ